MKQTLLEMTKDILSSMDGDEVVSITDTVESEQVATIIKQSYYDIVAPNGLSEHKNLFNLTATSVATPTVLTKPADVMALDWFQYNCRKLTDTVDIWEEIEYKDQKEFLQIVQNFDQSQTNVQSFSLTSDGYTATIYVENDRAPRYWTSFNDNTVVCDAYDVAVDATGLKTIKTNCFGHLLPSWTHSDGFTPDLDIEQFRLLYNEAKALAWAEMKQTIHQKAERKVRDGKIHLERKKQDLPGGDKTWGKSLPNYGRKS